MKTFASFQAIHDCQLNKTISFSEFYSDILSLKHQLLRDYNLKENDMLAYFGGNSYHFFVTFFACHLANISIAPLNSSLRDRERREVLQCLSPQAVFEQNKIRSTGLGSPLEISGLVLMSSGTTAKPKAYIHSWKKVQDKVSLLQSQISASNLKRSLCLLPTHFGHGLIGNSLLPLASGAEFFIQQPFASQLSVLNSSWISEKKITFLSSVPLLWHLWKTLPFSPIASLERVHIASANLYIEQLESIKAIAPQADIFNVFGMTELLSWVGAKKITAFEFGNVGSLWGCEWKILDAELWIKSPHLYDLELFPSGCEAAPKDGWFETGDLISLNSEGDIVLTGRRKRQINRAGQKVSPEEIEAQILAATKAEATAVVSIPHQKLEDYIVAFVVSSHVISEDDCIKSLYKVLSPHKVPDKIIQIDSLPMSDRGKINYLALQKVAKNYGP